jgi:GTPase KRas protein
MYSITSRASFDELEQFREQVLRVKDTDHFPAMVLVGNKCDLESERQVTTDEGRALARKWRIPFFESSAKVRINIEETLAALVRLVGMGHEFKLGKSTLSLNLASFVSNIM